MSYIYEHTLHALYMCICIGINKYVNTDASCVYSYINKYIDTYKYVYIYTCIYIYRYIHTRTHTHAHAYTHTYTHLPIYVPAGKDSPDSVLKHRPVVWSPAGTIITSIVEIDC